MTKENACKKGFETSTSVGKNSAVSVKSSLNSCSYLNFIVSALVLAALCEFCYIAQRAMLVASSFDDFSVIKSELLAMFAMGFRLDMRAVCVLYAMIILLGYAFAALYSLSLSLV